MFSVAKTFWVWSSSEHIISFGRRRILTPKSPEKIAQTLCENWTHDPPSSSSDDLTTELLEVLCISQFHLRPGPPRATAGHLHALSVPGVGHLQILHCPGGRAFANPGTIPEVLTRTRFPIRIWLHRRFYWKKKSRLAHLSRTGINWRGL